MIKLQNVSKYYYQKGMISSGISDVDLEFSLGEFVAITGESGSGKSTLLNVIAGLDSYEEGEMYVNGEETSYFATVDFENYRKKYIGNIFQSFNLINSYSVFKNIELVLLLRGEKKKDVKQRILDIIEFVGLTKFTRTKVSKLSGGQKQRVAIARVLAMDVPILLADEPTGNLDETSAKEIMQLLSEISKDKLVIIVTHNYELVEPYVTRKITMSDGHVFEDCSIKEPLHIEEAEVLMPRNISIANTIRLGVRNTFNLFTKFVLLLSVFLLLVSGVLSQYTSYKYQGTSNSFNGWNMFFSRNVENRRVVLKKADKTNFTEDDFNKIKAIKGVNYLIIDDYLLDSDVMMELNEGFTLGGTIRNINDFKGNLIYGRMPENDKEIIIQLSKFETYLQENPSIIDGSLSKLNFWRIGNYSSEEKYSICGIALGDDTYTYFYASDRVINPIYIAVHRYSSELTTTLNGKEFKNIDVNSVDYSLKPSPYVPSGNVYVSENMNNYCRKYNCKGSYIKTKINNLYYQDEFNGRITKVIKNKNLNKYFGLPNNGIDYSNTFFINDKDYEKLFNKGYFQISLVLQDQEYASTVIDELKTQGIISINIKDALYNPASIADNVLEVFRMAFMFVSLIVLYLISYFIVWIIIRSRNVYYSTVRILGGKKKTIKELISIELFIVANIAFVGFAGILELIKRNIIVIDMFAEAAKVIKPFDYLIVYVMLVVIVYLLSRKISKNLFKHSAMKTYREEV